MNNFPPHYINRLVNILITFIDEVWNNVRERDGHTRQWIY